MAFRVIALSGGCYTGTTTLAQRVASTLSWELVSAGSRFRRYCLDHGLSIMSIPRHAHEDFDRLIREELSESQATVFEGRYLGLFTVEIHDVLRVRVDADLAVRAMRCLEREPQVATSVEAQEYVAKRDAREREDAITLYNTDRYLESSYFNLVLMNNIPDDLDRGLHEITQLL